VYTTQQTQLLTNFANKSDQLFELGIIRSDSFTGEIGEHVVCEHLKLKKTSRVTQAVDAISEFGERYQIKAKVITNNSFNYTIKGLQTPLFDKLIIVYFDKQYNVLKIVVIPSSIISNNEINIKSSNISSFEYFDGINIGLSTEVKTAISEFAMAYNALEDNNIIRSRRIVGDIGEFYACTQLGLLPSIKKNEKGIDAQHPNGLTFEIKTRRVYESGRRTSETRRLNNLVGKSADFLIVVTIDRAFRCSGMWLIPMRNLTNPKSANLKVVNNTIGVLNVIPSQIPWLKTGEGFKGF
jgi:hypothetical protein